jgi:hypothetical protein
MHAAKLQWQKIWNNPELRAGDTGRAYNLAVGAGLRANELSG